MSISVISRPKKKKLPARRLNSASTFSFPRKIFSRSLAWEEPFQVFRSLSANDPLVFLDGSFAGGNLSRSLIAWSPYLWVRGRRSGLELNEGSGKPWIFQKTQDPYGAFRKLFHRLSTTLPFVEGMGAYGVLSYETGELFERLPPSAEKNPIFFEFIFPREVLVFDHPKKRLIHRSLAPAPETFQIFRRPISHRGKNIRISNLRAQFRQKAFEKIVARAKEYIRAGDIYQANLSQEFSFNFAGDPTRVFERLRQVNPSPFSSFLRFGPRTLVSSSPELLLRKSGSYCFTRPIAGTRPRGQCLRGDERLAKSLLLSPKERAEHLMLLDLERNDLGRVSRFGAVKVEEQMVLEKYSHVIHIVSQVGARLKNDKDVFDVIRSLFPGGTITGCPKIRSQEIIHELEKKPRGFYTGSLGFLGFSGEAVLNIIIRTLVFEGSKGFLRVGAGIVADSNPKREYWETIQKAKALFKTLGIGKFNARN